MSDTDNAKEVVEEGKEKKNWLDQWMKALERAETPKSFLFWAGLATLSGVARDNVYIDKQSMYRLYPNIFVMMIGKSGLKKSFAVNKSKELVTLVNGTRVISGQNSIQGIISELSSAKVDEKDPSKILKDAHAFVASEEFGDLIIQDPSAFTSLTNLYDRHYHATFERTLKNSPKQKLTNVNITMLAASSPAYFETTVPKQHITGGFLARFLTVYADRKSHLNPLIRPLQEGDPRYNPQDLIPHLQKLTKVKGQFYLPDETVYAFENWYQQFHRDDEGNIIERSDETGYEDRINDHILKVSMLLALAEPDPDLVIRLDHFERAKELCIDLVPSLHKAIMGVGKNPLASGFAIVLKELAEAKDHKIRRDELLFKHYGEFSYDELDRIQMTLEQGGFIDVEYQNKWAWYKMTPKGIMYYEKAKIKKGKK